MTFLELQQQAAREMDDESIEGDADMKALINRAYEDVCNEAPWRFLETTPTVGHTTTANQKSYDLPSDFKQMSKLTVGDESPDQDVEYQPISFADRKRFTSNAWYLWGSKYYLNPTPTATGTPINLYYLKKVTALSASADEPIIPSEFQEIIVTRFNILYKQRDEEYTAAREYMTVYNNLLDKMKAILLTPARGQMNRILQAREWMSVGNKDTMSI